MSRAELGDFVGGDPTALDDDVEHRLAGLEAVTMRLRQLAHRQLAGLDELGFGRWTQRSRPFGDLERDWCRLKIHSPQ